MDLTIYEFGNVLWKNFTKTHRLRKKEYENLRTHFGRLAFNLIRVESEDMKDICFVATENDLTVYDAAYVFYAWKFGLDLETTDEKMRNVWQKKKISDK